MNFKDLKLKKIRKSYPWLIFTVILFGWLAYEYIVNPSENIVTFIMALGFMFLIEFISVLNRLIKKIKKQIKNRKK